jgi:hypothetical protein
MMRMTKGTRIRSKKERKKERKKGGKVGEVTVIDICYSYFIYDKMCIVS